ncbi:DUF397 domain-containing protein [Streptomyces sp. NPDC048442]|uniref:DUF397 domain-containing protein n=1 Tax=Streptomyces sp. NPDC048442 TaxID=3154823 RepID=UPI003434AB87
MFQLVWQKSSFSTGGQNECVELSSDPTGRIHLRESDDPTRVTQTSPTGLVALLATVKAGMFSNPATGDASHERTHLAEVQL